MTDLTRRMTFPTALGAFTMLFAAPQKAGAASEGRPQEQGTPQEQAAIKLVGDFIAAAALKDANRTQPFVADDFVFKFRPASPELRGKQVFFAETQKFLSLPIVSKLSSAKTISRAYAVGGPAGTAVLAFRESHMDMDGKTVTIPLAAIFWVVGDKIKAFYDFPLIEDPKGMNEHDGAPGQG